MAKNKDHRGGRGTVNGVCVCEKKSERESQQGVKRVGCRRGYKRHVRSNAATRMKFLAPQWAPRHRADVTEGN